LVVRFKFDEVKAQIVPKLREVTPRIEVLTLSLAVTVHDEQMFVAYVAPFIRATLTAAELIVKTITTTLKQ
jgi:hypothetical protein